MDIEQVADELYGSATADFTKRRTVLAAQARKAGEPDVAKAVAELRRPTAAAALINQLVRQEQPDRDGQGGGADPGDSGGLVHRLLALGTRLREAQAELDGDQIRQLARQRHELVATLIDRATDLAADAGQKVSSSVQRELEETFGAALADEQAALAVTSGRLTRALVYAGFGEVDVSTATATPLTRGPGRRAEHPGRDARPPSRDAERRGGPTGRTERQLATEAARQATAEQARAAEVARAQDATRAALTALTETEADLADSAQERESALARETALVERLEQLQREIQQTRHDLDSASRKAIVTERNQTRQERRVRDARRAVEHAQRALNTLTRHRPLTPDGPQT